MNQFKLIKNGVEKDVKFSSDKPGGLLPQAVLLAYHLYTGTDKIYDEVYLYNNEFLIVYRQDKDCRICDNWRKDGVIVNELLYNKYAVPR